MMKEYEDDYGRKTRKYKIAALIFIAVSLCSLAGLIIGLLIFNFSLFKMHFFFLPFIFIIPGFIFSKKFWSRQHNNHTDKDG